MMEHFSLSESRLLWKYFFDNLEALQRSVYSKFQTDQQKDLIFSNLQRHLPSEFCVGKEEFMAVPMAKQMLDKKNNDKNGKKELFTDMWLISWYAQQESEEYKEEESISESVSEHAEIISVSLEPSTVDSSEFINSKLTHSYA